MSHRGASRALAMSRRVLSGALVALLAGCANGAAPTAPTTSAGSSPTSTTSETSSTVMSATVGTAPSSISTSSPAASPLAFPRLLVAQVNLSFRTASTTHLDTVLAAECQGCVGLLNLISGLKGRGIHASEDAWSLVYANALNWDETRAAFVMEVEQHAVAFVDDLGRRRDTMVANRVKYHLVIRASPQWMVTEWEKAS